MPTLTVIRPKRGITRNVAAMDTSPRQSSASGRADAVRCSDADRVIRGDQELEALPIATENRCRQRSVRLLLVEVVRAPPKHNH